MKKTKSKILLVIAIVVFTFVTSQVIIFAAKTFFTEPAENAGMESVLSEGEEQRLWVEKHIDSNAPLDVALVKYFNHIRNPYNTSGLSSKYEPEKDEGLNYLIDLGDKETDKMIDRIEKNDVWAGILMCAVEKIKKIDIPSEYKDASPEGIKKWVGYVKEKIK